jgi:hypothetical protein
MYLYKYYHLGYKLLPIDYNITFCSLFFKISLLIKVGHEARLTLQQARLSGKQQIQQVEVIKRQLP